MPLTLTNRQAQPVVLENPKHVADYIQGGDVVDFYNMFSGSVLVGEPVILFDRVGITKRIVPPNTQGTLHFGAWAYFRLDPALAANIHQGDKIYFDYDLAVANVAPGYATNVEPTNGILLGHATIVKEQSLSLGTGNKPIVATTSSEFVAVKMSNQVVEDTVTAFGTVPNWVAGT